jgi:ATP-dependent RNA helicase DHX29
MRHITSKETVTEQATTKGNTAVSVALTPKKPVKIIEYESDIDADELLPVYLDTKVKLFHLQPTKRSMQSSNQRGRGGGNNKRGKNSQTPVDPEIAKLQSKLQKIESDILFDQYVADQEWQKKRIELEKEAASQRQALSGGPPERIPHPAEVIEDSDDDEITREAARIGAELLEEDLSDDDAAIADLFASLPVTEVDPVSGKSTIVVNGADGSKVTIRDFGKSMGVSPRRVLEEACRSRDPSVKIAYTLVSAASFSNRHSVRINWSKAQEALPSSSEFPEIECSSSPRSVTITMASISTPDATQSESYVATVALFLIFSTSVREEKVFLRLPPAWRELWMEFAVLRKEKADALDRDAIRGFRDMIREKRDREEEDGVVLTTSFRRRALLTPNDTSDESGPDKPGTSRISPESLQRIWADKCLAPSYQMILQSRMQLPMWSYKSEVLHAIDREQVVIICGETGCGKSTQVPSFILEHQLSQGKPCKIYCTEPRRISAISLAKRVSEEIGERKNDVGTPRSLVGYAIRLETKTSKETRLVYATTGIVMRMLEGSNDLKEVTHIVLDEVHERTIDSDFLLIILRKLMVRRPDLKVILMSATVDAERFSKYLDGAPVLQVPGRTFPVTSYYLEDAVELTGYSLDNGSQDKKYTDLDDDAEMEDTSSSEKTKAENTKSLRGYSAKTRNTIFQMDEYRIDFELVTQLIAKIANDERYVAFSKAILVFLPGIGEIRQLNDMLIGHPAFRSNWYVYPLHSSIASEDQEAAFLVPPPGTRKIVLATNIAETGITIPDVTCVIDAGKHREMRFDERRQLSRLLETFISKANAKQRRGRAGRVQEGLCFHLFTKYRHDELMADQQTPELLRLSLQDLAIRVKTCKLGGIEETLAQALDPPSAKNIRRAIDALIDVRALTPAEELTPLGVQLSRLPLDVFLGKLILLGSIFKCLDAAITIAAILSSKSPFQAPFGARQQADTVRLGFRRGDSDLLTNYNAYLAWKRVCNTTGSEYQFCRKNFLSSQTLSNIEDLKGQLTVSLVDSGFLPLTEQEKSHIKRNRYSSRRHDFFELPQRANVNSENDLITQSVIAWALYPKLLVRDGKGFRNVANNQSISLHPTSVNKGHHEINWLSYYHIMQAKQYVFLVPKNKLRSLTHFTDFTTLMRLRQ